MIDEMCVSNTVKAASSSARSLFAQLKTNVRLTFLLVVAESMSNQNKMTADICTLEIVQTAIS